MSRTAVKEKPSAGIATNGNGHLPASTIKQIRLDEISVSMLEPQVRRREHFKPDELQELADSILSMGLISPITVRPWNPRPVQTGKGTDYEPTYQLVAGERRYLATKLAGLETIEAVVRQLDDQQTIEIQLHENLKRLEIEPLDEAFSYKYLIDHAQILESGVPRPYTVADIAAKFSRTEKIILRRLKLNDLCEKGRKDLADGKLPLAHAELVACFPEKEQTELLSRYVYTYSGNANALKDVRSNIERSIVRGLTKAPFDVKDPRLHPKGLVCADCPQRTGYMPGLFEGELGQKDSCINGKCYSAKIAAALKFKRTEIAETRPNPKNKHTLERLEKAVPLIRNYWSNDVTPLGKDATYVEDRNYDKKFEKAKKLDECPDVETALWVEGDNIGKTQLICRNGKCKVHKTEKQTSSRSTTSMSPERKEEQLNDDVLEKVRKTVLTAHIKTFNAKRTVWITPELRRRLLLSMIENSYLLDDKTPEGLDEEFFPAPLKKLVNAYNADPKKVQAELDKLTAEQESRLFALFTFGDAGYADYNDKPDLNDISALAKEAGLNYQLLDAEARLELVPEKNKETIRQYIEQVKAGTATEPPKIFTVPKPEKKKKPAVKKEAKK